MLGVLALTAAIATGASSATTAFTEPTEKAYTVQIPRGWHANGGVVRKSPTNARPWVSVSDGATTLFMGDPDPDFKFLYYVKSKSPQSAPPDGIAQAPYENGSAFAAEYGLKTLPQHCTDVRLMSTQPEPALTSLVHIRQTAFLQDELRGANVVGAEWLRENPPTTSLDGGSALFTCKIGTKPYAARISAVTSLMSGPLVTIWGPSALQGFITPAALADDAGKHLADMSTSYRDDAWRKDQADEAAYKFAQVLQPSAMPRYQQIVRFLEQKPVAHAASAAAKPVFTDPLAGAFTVAVPQGYTMEGSVSDTAPSPMPVWLAAATADLETVLFTGNMLRLIEPQTVEDHDGMTAMPGTCPPDACSPPFFRVTTADGTVLPEGTEKFAAAYGTKLFAHLCDNTQLTGTRPEPELAQVAKAQYEALQNRIAGRPTLNMRLGDGPPSWNGGSATFACKIAGKNYVARIDIIGIAQIQRWGPMGDFGEKWSLASIMGFRAPEGATDKTEKVLADLNSAIRWNDIWLQKTFPQHY